MTANHEHTPTDEEMQELFETGAMVTEFAHSRQEATIDWQLWLQERDARIEAAAEQRGAEEGWDLAIDYAWDDSSIYEADAKRAKAANPYRADQEGDDE